MSKKDPNYVVKLEKAIAEKYGEETIQNPKKNWNEEKEYLDQSIAESRYQADRQSAACLNQSLVTKVD